MIYLDNAATTCVLPEVFDAMRPWFCENYGNPSAAYRFGDTAQAAVDRARKQTADLIGASPREIVFTAGGSESDNWALKASAESRSDRGRHIITTRIEHHAVLHTAQWLEKQGVEVTYLDPDREGRIAPESVEAAIRPDTILISVMTANNEVGTIQPVEQIGAIARRHNILFHTDAVQAVGHIPMHVETMNIDLLSASGHKFHGPKGVGFLYVRKGIRIPPLIHGGAQERNRRAGTLNVPGIVGMGEAAALAQEHLAEWKSCQENLRDYMRERIGTEIPGAHFHGCRESCLPGHINVGFDRVEGESLLILMDTRGVCVSSGSACTSGSLDPSHVLLAMGLSHEEAQSSIRITLSEKTTREEADQAVNILKETVKQIRRV